MGRALPFFSVIIPTLERSDQLVVCLRALACQSYSRERFEVIVVDDGSVNSPQRIARSFRDQLDIRFFSQRHAGPAAARNHGAAYAKGTFLAFTDDDCAPSPNWLQTLATSFACFPDCALGGRTINGAPDNSYATTSQLVIDYLYAHYNTAERATFLTSNNLAFPAKGFHAVGGFDGAWKRAAGEDRELCNRWIAHGYKMVYVVDAVVKHIQSLTWHGFCRQHFNYGRGAFYVRRARARSRGGLVPIEPPSFYLGILRYPFSQARTGQALRLSALMLGAQTIHAAGFFWEGHIGARNSLN
jgi:glycosyltransferase involved in cell wall biosynthesis